MLLHAELFSGETHFTLSNEDKNNHSTFSEEKIF